MHTFDLKCAGDPLTCVSPASPAQMDWASHYPAYAESPISSEGAEDSPMSPDTTSLRKMKQDVEVADIGCGFGGLTVALAPKLPNTLILGTIYGMQSIRMILTFFGRDGDSSASYRICTRTP